MRKLSRNVAIYKLAKLRLAIKEDIQRASIPEEFQNAIKKAKRFSVVLVEDNIVTILLYDTNRNGPWCNQIISAYTINVKHGYFLDTCGNPSIKLLEEV